MNNKPPKEISQLSFPIEDLVECVTPLSISAEAMIEKSNVLDFPCVKQTKLSFRDRVISDLVRNRVIAE